MLKLVRWNITVLILWVLISSCSKIKDLQIRDYLAKSNCNQRNIYNFIYSDLPEPIHEIGLDAHLVSRFSFSSLNVANAIGIMDLLSDYISVLQDYKENLSDSNKLRLLEIAYRIERKIDIASLEVSSVAAELDCEEERVTQIADYLRHKENEIESSLTVAAIGVGSVGAIISGLFLANIGTGDLVQIVGVTGGIIEVAIGLMILTRKRKVELSHDRNALREVWDGKPTSSIFPPSVWYYLNYYNPYIKGYNSLRYQIIDKWMSFKQIAEADSKKRQLLIDLYFGNGGLYTTEQLYNRGNMYDQLESNIKLMKQDLMELSIEFEKLY